MIEIARTHAELWSASSPWEHAWSTVRANRLTELASLGVEVANPAALGLAYDDAEIMARLAGREMRAARAIAHPQPLDAEGLADQLRTARLASQAHPRAFREMLR